MHALPRGFVWNVFTSSTLCECEKDMRAHTRTHREEQVGRRRPPVQSWLHYSKEEEAAVRVHASVPARYISYRAYSVFLYL